MGAHDFTKFVPGEQDASTAYKQAVDQALFEHQGYDPYNGTISTTEGFMVVRGYKLSMDEARALAASYWVWEAEEIDYEAGDYERARREHESRNPLGAHRVLEKWGACAAVQIDGGTPGWLFFGIAAS
jgi:hypothetical protein